MHSRKEEKLCCYFVKCHHRFIKIVSPLSSQSPQDMSAELKAKKAVVAETEQNLKAAKSSCDNMAAKVQEHCPDIERQEMEVQKLSKRFDNAGRQIDSRWASCVCVCVRALGMIDDCVLSC